MSCDKVNKGQIKRLACYFQDYAWGKKGPTSMVYELLDENIKNKVKQDSNFAELWMGTHPNLPSMIQDESTLKSLKELILDSPDINLGKPIRENFGDDLPFLFKVLSINKALSIQAHPDKKLAEILHTKRPDIYKDGNHKPEMAVALTQFEALCGFRPLNEIYEFIKALPEFQELLERNGDKVDFNVTDELVLRKIFHNLMTSPEELVKQQLDKLFQRLEAKPDILRPDISELAFRLHNQYPGDVGIFCSFMLNFVVLSPGQAIFLGANEPHAYLKGDCIECMATSDNVIRAGLTPKFKDVEVLTSMLTYNCDPIAEKIFSGVHMPGSPYSLLYDPPIPEFSVISIRIPDPGLSQECKISNGPGILLVTSAPLSSLLVSNDEQYMLSKGNVFFIPPNTEFSMTFGHVPSVSPLQAFFAYCSL
ncbi:Mannose-6-phosphate isomerase, variant 3 [Entomophthora muscae]|uniref:Mannose-6-phosphate isomerase, variant 3 n=2 Tax=Entomophthora muscae TaxID=34485 RepID=A0ACC2U2V7_9FUNG|nr:Mannose-6-phosphate isomerase, variant 3 [Entomophthora muscae]